MNEKEQKILLSFFDEMEDMLKELENANEIRKAILITHIKTYLQVGKELFIKEV